jgi:hypothetical protein
MALVPLVYDQSVTMKLTDGTTPTAVTLTSDLFMSGETIDGLGMGGDPREAVPVFIRGELVSVLRGNPALPTVAFQFMTSAPEGSEIQNFLLRRGPYAANASTGGDGMCPYAVDIDITLNSGCAATPPVGSILKARKVHGTLSLAGQENGAYVWSFTGTAYGGMLGDENTSPTPTASEAYSKDPNAL